MALINTYPIFSKKKKTPEEIFKVFLYIVYEKTRVGFKRNLQCNDVYILIIKQIFFVDNLFVLSDEIDTQITKLNISVNVNYTEISKWIKRFLL